MNKPGTGQYAFALGSPAQTVSGAVTWNTDDPAVPAKINGQSEPKHINQAFKAYLRLDEERSPAALRALLEREALQTGRLPTQRQLQNWEKRYAWQERARDADALRQERESLERANRQRSILQEGVATTVERVAELKNIYAQLKSELQSEDRIWLLDVRYQRKNNEEFERVEHLTFNAALFAQARGVLADLAKETGGRNQQSEISAAPQAAAQQLYFDFSDLEKEELDVLEKVLLKAGLSEEFAG